ncbi:MAG: DivIVA domain-containing protein [Gemmatimonadetes bacterium]|nr:DivIVA domain-containing protein [Gemmatimonadota bacterium]
MIDITPLDVRKKRGDFGKGLRGYDPQEVDTFLELVAERMEVLVKENLAFRGMIEGLEEKVVSHQGREQAIQDALVTAQELRQDVKKQASREAKLLEREAQGRVDLMIGESEKLLAEHRGTLQELERKRERFLKAFRTLLERELDTVEVEFGRAPLEDVTLDLDLGRGSRPAKNQGKNDHEAEGKNDHEAADKNDDKEDAGPQNERRAERAVDPAPSGTGSDARKAESGKEGDDSLWLSSIVTDRKDEDAE